MTRSKPVLYWTPRVLGLLAAAFLALFAFDVFGEGHTARDTAIAFAMHLIPTAIVLAAVAVAWRWEVVGGVLFIAAGIAYAIMVGPVRHATWVVVIAGPLWVTGALFLASHAAGAGASGPKSA